MAYTNTNFKTKKALKDAVKASIEAAKTAGVDLSITKAVRCHQPGQGPDLSNFTGNIALEGPHYPAAHTWYAEATLKNGVVVKVK